MVILHPSWAPAPAGVKLTPDAVHVWCALLNQPESRFYQLARTLSPDEQMRADKFYFEHDKRHFIVGRGVLRMLLSQYTGIDPRALQFKYGRSGKPFLVNAEDLRFNISHSKDLALYGFTYNREIGVDIEYMRTIDDFEQIAERFFSAKENEVFRTLPYHKRMEGFYNCWTRKEAYIKATGDGLSYSLDRFDVTLAPGEEAKLLSIDGNAELAAEWRLETLRPAADYIAAVLVKGSQWHLERWRWS